MARNPYVPLHAVLIGINDYAVSEPLNGLKPLKGAVDDAKDFKHYLERCLGVSEEQICLLLNEAATHSAIINSLIALRHNDRIQTGDPVFIYFAGHGTQLKAPQRWECGGPNALIQAIVPYDCDTVDACTNTLIGPIHDRTLNVLLSMIAREKGNNITVVFDCCHSSSGTRGSGGSTIDLEATSRSAVLAHEYAADALDRHIWDDVSARGLYRPSHQQHGAYHGLDSHVLLAACRSDEEALESFTSYKNGKRGRFSTVLLKLLHEVSPEKLRYSEVLHWADRVVGQNPQCEGSYKERFLFDSKIQPSRRKSFEVYYGKQKKDGPGCYFITAGKIHKITPHSEFSVFVKSDPDFTKPVGTLTIKDRNDIGPFSSIASLRLINGNLKDTNFYAIQTKSGRKDIDLRIFVPHGNGFPELYKRLRKSPHHDFSNIIRVKNSSSANMDIELRQVSDRSQPQALFRIHAITKNIPGFPANSIPEWTKTVDIDPSDLSELAGVFLKAASFYRELKLMDPFPNLSKNVEVNFYKLDEDFSTGEFFPAEPLINLCRGNVVSIPDDPEIPYGLKLVNHSLLNLHANMFYFSNQDLKISPLVTSDAMAPYACSASLQAKGTLAIGWGAAGFPPICCALDDCHGDITIGFIKIYLSTQPVDLSYIIQSSPFSLENSRNLTRYDKNRPLWMDKIVPVIQYRHPPARNRQN